MALRALIYPLTVTFKPQPPLTHPSRLPPLTSPSRVLGTLAKLTSVNEITAFRQAVILIGGQCVSYLSDQ